MCFIYVRFLYNVLYKIGEVFLLKKIPIINIGDVRLKVNDVDF